MSDVDKAGDELLEQMGKELMKLHREYDGSNRLEFQYETFATTVDGGPAIKTTYTYVGATTDVLAMKEELSTWDSAWDI